MQNLWKKESHHGDAILVDLLAEYRESGAVTEWDNEFRASNWNHCFESKVVKPIKNNKVSDEFRNEGNVFFREGEWEEAMNSYNHALRFAEVGTDNVSLAYANRSACFLKMQLYGECLIGIELAIKANYPKHLMSKLMNRKNECQKELGFSNFTMEQFIPKLDFKPNKKFPCMADVLRIERNEEFGRHIVASKDIDVGMATLVEKPFVSTISEFQRTYCYECFEINKNFIACSSCTDAMFCSAQCQNQNDFHQQFCGSNIDRMARNDKFLALIALAAITNIDDLMSFVDDVLSKRAMEVPQAANDPRSKYATFLSLQPAKTWKHDIQTIHIVYKGLLDIPSVKSMFSSEKSQRFLMHLIVEHALIIANNSFGGEAEDILGCISSLFNHNCAPNLFNTSIANREVYTTIAPIKKGQQLFISYIRDDQTTRERQISLLLRWNFLCKCDKCEPIKSGATLVKDSRGQSIKHVGISNYMEFCKKFREFGIKYGRHPRPKEIRELCKP